MANKRFLKKALNYMIEEIVNDCFTAQSYDPSTEEATDAIIAQAMALKTKATSKMRAAKNKQEMTAVVEEIKTASEKLFEKMENL